MAKVFLLTGLSGAGKTTIARAVYERMRPDRQCVVLDGDEMRAGINRDLGFSKNDRTENIRRCGEIARLLISQDINVLVAAIAPYQSLRADLQNIVGRENLRIIYVSCALEECIRRDPKNNYKKAMAGKIQNYTGLRDPYETPENPDLIVHTDLMNAEECGGKVFEYVCGQL